MESLNSLRTFMFANVYGSPQVLEVADKEKVDLIIRSLYDYYLHHPEELPGVYKEIEKEDGTQVFHRPIMHLVHTMPERLRIGDTDNGTELKEQIRNLEALHEAFRSGRIREIFE